MNSKPENRIRTEDSMGPVGCEPNLTQFCNSKCEISNMQKAVTGYIDERLPEECEYCMYRMSQAN
jgi:hypothetical protein